MRFAGSERRARDFHRGSAVAAPPFAAVLLSQDCLPPPCTALRRDSAVAVAGQGQFRTARGQQPGAPAVWNVSVVARVARSISAYFSRLAALSRSERSAAVAASWGMCRLERREAGQLRHEMGGRTDAAKRSRGTGEAL